jgi:hypothetical protein
MAGAQRPGMRTLIAATLLSSLVACGSSPASGEFPEEDLPESADGKADGTGLWTYYRIVPSNSGLAVARVNLTKTRCGDGRKRLTCPLADIKLIDDAIATPEENEVLGFDATNVLYHGRLEAAPGGKTRLVADARFKPMGYAEPEGVFVHAFRADVTCLELDGCAPYTERKLNSSRQAQREAYVFNDDSFEPAYQAVAQGRLDSNKGLYMVGSLDGDGIRHLSQVWTEIQPRTFEGCGMGCDGQTCIDADAGEVTICDEAVPTCMSAFGECRRDQDGVCGWQTNDDTESCEGAGGL